MCSLFLEAGNLWPVLSCFWWSWFLVSSALFSSVFLFGEMQSGLKTGFGHLCWRRAKRLESSTELFWSKFPQLLVFCREVPLLLRAWDQSYWAVIKARCSLFSCSPLQGRTWTQEMLSLWSVTKEMLPVGVCVCVQARSWS